MTTSRAYENKPVENIVGKGENAGNLHFLLSPQCFLSYKIQIYFLSNIWFVFCYRFQFGQG